MADQNGDTGSKDRAKPVLHITAAPGYRVPRDQEPMNPKQPAKSTPCATCPFRIANRDRRTDRGWEKWLSTSYQRECWENPDDPDSMCNGGLNHCHQGHIRACAGLQAVQERELLRFHAEDQRSGLDAALRACALTIAGLERVAARMFRRVGEIPRLYELTTARRENLLKRAHPAVNDPAIGHPSTEPLRSGEFEE